MSTNPKKSIIAKEKPIMLFDGQFQGNWGQGAAAAILLMPNGRRYTVSQLVSVDHKDEAEYTALIIGLKKAQKLGLKTLEVKGDSDLIFNQVNGLTPITEERLIKLYRIAITLMRSFEKASLEWISAEQNRPAKSAVRRCISDALGPERQAQPQLPAPPLPLQAGIALLVAKGEEATDEDYRQLRSDEDQWTKKTLSQLRNLIPLEVRDAIALQWQGDEENLAQMYRWHLRGLPPIMACRKVNLDQKTDTQRMAKLPWEEALNLPTLLSTESNNLSESLTSLLSELDDPPHYPQTSAGSSPDSPWESLLPSDHDHHEVFPQEEISLSSTHEDESDSNLSFEQENRDSTIDVNQDRSLSTSRVIEVLKVIDNLSEQEQVTLAQELAKMPEMVNLILKAIADNVSQGKSES
ncbi:MAG: reverse transcriptase-like protein [Crocosphaera sp.]